MFQVTGASTCAQTRESKSSPHIATVGTLRILLVVNSFASSVTARNTVIVHRRLSRGHDVEVVETNRRGHATRFAHDAARRGIDVVIGFGGFASFPGALMAVARNIPLVVHNLDAKPGLANRVLRFGADRVLTGFPGVLGEGRDPRVEWVGNPLRADIVAALPPEDRFAGRSGPLTVLVVGGSLGAVALNECVPRALALMPPGARPVVTHQAGEKHIDALVAEYERAGVAAECVAFIADMGRRYAEADVVIARSGATTVAELAAVGAASVLVPYPHAADDHQVDNARQLADRGASVLILQRDLSPEGLAAWLGSVTRGQLLAMAQAARALRRADAVARVADVCIELGSRQ